MIYAVSKAAQNSKEPNLEDWENLKRILKYLKGTIKIWYKHIKKLQYQSFGRCRPRWGHKNKKINYRIRNYYRRFTY